MATKKIDSFERRIPRPRSIRDAKELGELTIKSFLKIYHQKDPSNVIDPDHPELMDPSNPESGVRVFEMLRHAGRTIGEEMYRTKSKWTLKVFQSRLSGFVDSHTV